MSLKLKINESTPKEKKNTLFEINFSSVTILFLVVFIGLKLGHVVDWSWWWVLCPLWFPLVALASAWVIVWLLLQHTRKNIKGWY